MAVAISFNVSLRLPQASNLPFITNLRHLPRSVVAFARRGNRTTAITSKRKKEVLRKDVIKEMDDSDGVDPFEVLFGMLEEDLKNLDDELLGIDDDEDDEDISPEELAKLEKELDAAIGESEELMQLLNISDDYNDDDNDDVIDVGIGVNNKRQGYGEGEVELELKDWQLKKLADASKVGRRRTNIKSLAAELGLDRDIVLDLLRIPSEVLLSMSTTNSSSSNQNHKSSVVLDAEYKVLEDAPDNSSKLEAKSNTVGANSARSKRPSQKSRKNVPQ